jgi:hypothetical protein
MPMVVSLKYGNVIAERERQMGKGISRAWSDDDSVIILILKAQWASKVGSCPCVWLLMKVQYCASVTVVGTGKLLWIACCWLDHLQTINNLELRLGLENISMISSLQQSSPRTVTLCHYVLLMARGSMSRRSDGRGIRCLCTRIFRY